MIYTSAEGPIQIPAIDFVSFCFDRQDDFDEEKPVLIDADETSRCLNYKQYRTLVRKLIAGFKAYGLHDGDSVLCQVGNTYLYPALFMSIVGAGGVWMASNPENQYHEIDHHVQLGTPKFIITEAASLSKTLAICGERSIPNQNVIVLDIDTFPLYIGVPSVFWGCSDAVKTSNSTRSFTDLLCHGEQDWKTISTAEEAQNTPCVCFSTSGTTDLPKLAMVSHQTMVARHMMLHQETPYKVTRIVAVPFFHMFGTSLAFVQPIRYGHTTYVMRRWQLEEYLLCHDKYQATEAYMAPAMLIAMIRSDLDVKDLMKTVRFAGVGGTPCDALSINKMRSLLTDATMTCMWGLTETGIATAFRYGENDETGSVGRLFRGTEAKLIDVDGHVVTSDGEAGELYCRTKGVMLGYRNMESSDKEKEWFRTGDVCCFKHGKLYFVARAKELIKVKGWQVAPAEIEAVLLQHPEVVDAAVCGTTAANGTDEVPRAYVVRQKKLHEASMISADEVYQFSRARLDSYKALDGGVCFVEEIPRTASGKIQRAKLVKMNRYRQSITDVLLAAFATMEQLKQLSDVEDPAMQEAEIALRLRRISRLSFHWSRASTSSSSSEEFLGSLRMRPRRNNLISSSSSEIGSPATTVRIPKKVQKRQSRKGKTRKLVKAVQAAAA